MMELKERIDLERLPKHIAIIMDGNGRWAKKQGKMRIFGHEHGVIPVRETAEAAAELGVEYVTLYAFSKENWNRPKYEVDALMSLLVKTINKEIKTLQKNNIRLKAIGDIASLPEKTRNQLQKAIDDTARNERMTLVLALSYGSRWEIAEACRRIAEKVKNNELAVEDIDNDLFGNHLNTAGMPDPELLIRTSGELRISNFLLWQIAYTELFFTEKLWPDFRKEDLYEAILDFQNRERRFGKTSEQIQEQ
jgi:undecaprenyl diphosphate synthase